MKGVTVIKDDHDFEGRSDVSKSKIADSVTVEKPADLSHDNSGFDLFTAIMIPLQLVIVVLYGLFGEYGDGLDIGRYPLYQVGNI